MAMNKEDWDRKGYADYINGVPNATACVSWQEKAYQAGYSRGLSEGIDRGADRQSPEVSGCMPESVRAHIRYLTGEAERCAPSARSFRLLKKVDTLYNKYGGRPFKE